MTTLFAIFLCKKVAKTDARLLVSTKEGFTLPQIALACDLIIVAFLPIFWILSQLPTGY